MPFRDVLARVVQGRSKLLDNRGKLLRLLRAAPQRFHDSSIQLLVDIRAGFDEAWSVERLVTFEHLVTFEQMVDRRRPVGSRSLPGYAAGFMGSASHLPEAASNRRQIDPLETGCAYADGVLPLLPLMRRVGRFVDQQAFGSGA